MAFFKKPGEHKKPGANKSVESNSVDNTADPPSVPVPHHQGLMSFVHGYAEPDPAEVSTFLQHVAYGEQKEAQAMLAANPLLAVTKGTLTDYSGREFKEVTGLQYALWAQDAHMWQMIEKHFPKDELIKELKLPNAMKTQFDEVKSGLTYTLKVDQTGMNIVDKNELKEKEQKGEIQTLTKKESQYNFEELTSALKTFCDYIKTKYVANNSRWGGWPKADYVEAGRIFREVVGRAQRLMPAHVAGWYNSKMSFKNATAADFDAKKEMPPRSLTGDVIFPLDQNKDRRLGDLAGIFKGTTQPQAFRDDVTLMIRFGFHERVLMDLAAITALCEARQQDLKSFEEKLEKMAELEQSQTMQYRR